MKKILFGVVALLVSVVLFTNCSDDETTQMEHIYTIGVAEESYSGSGDPLAPMNYIGTLGIPERITYPAAQEKTMADQNAIAKFNSEMAKIDVAKLTSFGGVYIRYELTCVMSQKVLASKVFGSK